MEFLKSKDGENGFQEGLDRYRDEVCFDCFLLNQILMGVWGSSFVPLESHDKVIL